MLKKVSAVFLWFLMLVYSVILVKLILFKKQIGPVKYGYMHQYTFKTNLELTNLVPFKGIIGIVNSGNSLMFILQNICGNIIGFMPLGFFVYYLFSSVTAAKALKISFLTSLVFEILQIIFVLGHFDVDDLILNSLGGLLGYYCAVLTARVFGLLKWRRNIA